jgi:UbiD family decarboxylase
MSTSKIQHNDLREFLELCRARDELVDVHGADWNLEIGALTEAVSEQVPGPPALLFDDIKDYPQGFRVFTRAVASPARLAMAVGIDPDLPKIEMIKASHAKFESNETIAPRVVTEAPILENVVEGDDIDLNLFPATLFVPGNGGRFLGTGDNFITRDPESGYVNVGTYRMQVHEKDLLGLWISPGQQGRTICESYWKQGKSAPVAVTFGGDPTNFVVSQLKLPWGVSEYDFVGGLRQAPMDVIQGELTGLPIPAGAEIAIEGEVPPPGVESRDEGPFGEWPGYYSGGTAGSAGEPQPVIRVKKLYYRNNPIFCDETPMWPGAPQFGFTLHAGLLWQQLKAAGVQGIVGVNVEDVSYWVIISIKQAYAGHAKQVAMAAMGCSAAARHGRYIVIVDEDIDPTNWREVMWAMETRVDPATDIDIIDGAWSTPLDPRMSQRRRSTGDHTNSRGIFYATRQYEERDVFPVVSRSPKELQAQAMARFGHLFQGR